MYPTKRIHSSIVLGTYILAQGSAGSVVAGTSVTGSVVADSVDVVVADSVDVVVADSVDVVVADSVDVVVADSVADSVVGSSVAMFSVWN